MEQLAELLERLHPIITDLNLEVSHPNEDVLGGKV
jgi:hypothetical protein